MEQIGIGQTHPRESRIRAAREERALGGHRGSVSKKYSQNIRSENI
jgi:hypothetical protein